MPCSCLLFSTQLVLACWRALPHTHWQLLLLPTALPHLGSSHPIINHHSDYSVNAQSALLSYWSWWQRCSTLPVASSSWPPGPLCSPSLPWPSLHPSAAPALLSASTCSAVGLAPSAMHSTSTPSSWRSLGSAATSCCGRPGCAWQAGLPCTCRCRQLHLSGNQHALRL